eukprot:TRINITY_DN2526_c0_g2_i2.p1 TRINITY_DN2526_c0_g2~~TRINITY_DN2526_c0_g2_i2.p1  ORF type:complete len:211 (-),score=39.68 TRINITY_DN2526_c0_g2_i2:68-622(-)
MQHGFVVVTVAVVVAFLGGCGSTGNYEGTTEEEIENLQKCLGDEWANMTAVRSKAEKCSPEFTSATEDVVQKFLQCCERAILHSERAKTACRKDQADTGHEIMLDLEKVCPPLEETVPDARGFEQINLTEKLQDMFDSVPDVRDFEDASFTRTNVGMVALVVAAAGAAGASVALAITSLKTRRQ